VPRNGVVEDIFLRAVTTLGWKPKIFLSGYEDSCAMLPSWRRPFCLEFRCCLGGGCTVAARTKVPSGTFLFLFFFLMCASGLLLGYCVVAEVGCNWYLMILIYYLYRKNIAEPLRVKLLMKLLQPLEPIVSPPPLTGHFSSNNLSYMHTSCLKLSDVCGPPPLLIRTGSGCSPG
jgi:hypothetical protein